MKLITLFQVESLLRCSSYLNRSSGDDLTLRLLRSTLSEAVHQILHLSEDEPYGVRGATIKLRIKDVEGNVQTLGNIVVDNNTVLFKRSAVPRTLSVVSFPLFLSGEHFQPNLELRGGEAP